MNNLLKNKKISETPFRLEVLSIFNNSRNVFRDIWRGRLCSRNDFWTHRPLFLVEAPFDVRSPKNVYPEEKFQRTPEIKTEKVRRQI